MNIIDVLYMGLGYEFSSHGKLTGLCYRNFSPVNWSDVITHMEQGDEVHVVHPTEAERAHYDAMMAECKEKELVLENVKLDNFNDRWIAEHWNKINDKEL